MIKPIHSIFNSIPYNPERVKNGYNTIIRGLKLHNFRGYKDLYLSIDNDLSVLIGRNDVGKSTILEALEIFFNSDQVKLDQDDLCILHEDNDETKIEDYEYANRTDIKTVIIPETVTSIGNNAFSGCTSLRNCNLDIQVQTAVSYGITGTFPQCKEWTTDIPLTDEDGDGIFTVVISGLPAMSYQFKVRVNGEWTDSWGELDDGVTYNSQNNCNVEVKENETLFVYFDTTVGDRNLWPVKYESR